MNEFFTPIQVPKTPPITFEPYDIQKYDNDPFLTINPIIQSISDHRRKIINWLKSLPIPVRINKLTYTNKQFTTLLIKMFEVTHERSTRNLKNYEFAIGYDSYRQFMKIHRGYVLSDPRQTNIIDEYLMKAERNMLQGIVIANIFTRFDSVTVSQSFASDIDKLFELFSMIENGVSHEITEANSREYENYDSPLLFFNPNQYAGSTKSLCSWFVEIIKKTVSLKYYQEVKNTPEASISFKQNFTISSQEKQRAVRKFWKNSSKEQRQKIIDHIFSMDIYNMVNEYRQNIRVTDISFPRIRVSSSVDFQDFKKALVLYDDEKEKVGIYEKLVYTYLPHTIESLNTYKYELLIEIEQILENAQKNLSMKKKSKKDEQAKPKEEQKTKNPVKKIQFTYGEGSQKKESITSSPSASRVQNKLEISSPNNSQKIVTIKPAISCLPPNTSKNQKSKNNENKKKANTKNLNSVKDLKMMSETTNDVEEELSEQESKHSIVQIAEESKIQNQFNKVHTQITQKSNSSNKLKKIAINRISSILQDYNLSFKIFGSYNYGLSLPNSDVDFCIDPTIVHYFYGSFCSYRQKITKGLDFLKTLFEQQVWSKNMNLITTASVPLLAFDVDLSVYVPEPKSGIFNPVKHPQNPKQYLVSIDLTIEPFANMIEEVPAHLGYESTNLIKEWLQEYEKLPGLILIFKYLLSKENLNKTFTGGISSFTLIVLLVGFLESQKKSIRSANLTTKELISKFCQNFSEFGKKTCIVDVRSDKPVVFLPENNQHKFSSQLVIVSPLNNKNLSDGCYRLGEIRSLLGKIGRIVQNRENRSHKEYKKALRNLFFD